MCQPISVLAESGGACLGSTTTNREGRFTLALPFGLEQVALRLDSLDSRPEVVARVATVSQDEVDLGSHSFAGTGVAFRLLGSSAFESMEARCSVVVWESGGSLTFSRTGCLPEEEAQVLVEAAGGEEYAVAVFTEGVHERSQGRGALTGWREHVVDLASLCWTEVSLRGLAPETCAGRTVWFVTPAAETSERSRWFQTLDAGGRLHVARRAPVPVSSSLELDVGPPVELFGRDGREVLLACDRQELVPREPIVGLVLLDAEGVVQEDLIHRTGVDGRKSAGVHLLRASLIESGEPLHLSARGVGAWEVPVTELVRLDAWTIGAVMPSAVAPGSVTVWTDESRVDESLRVLATRAGVAVGDAHPAATEGEISWALGPLVSGEYELWWAYGTRGFPRRLVAAIDVAPGRLERIHASPPAFVELPGAFEAWESLPTHWRPQLLLLEGKSARVGDDGTFSLQVALPLASSSPALSFLDRAPAVEGIAEIRLSPGRDHLVVRLPQVAMGTVVVCGRGGFLDNPLGDESDLRIEYWVREGASAGPCSFRVGETTLTRLDGDASVRIPRRTSETIVGCLLSWDASGRGLPLGFFEAPPERSAVKVSCEGRRVSVPGTGVADVTMVWDSPSGHEVQCALGTLDLAANAIWCPRDADRLILRDARGVSVLDVRP